MKTNNENANLYLKSVLINPSILPSKPNRTRSNEFQENIKSPNVKKTVTIQHEKPIYSVE